MYYKYYLSVFADHQLNSPSFLDALLCFHFCYLSNSTGDSISLKIICKSCLGHSVLLASKITNKKSTNLGDIQLQQVVKAYYHSFSNPYEICSGCSTLSHCGGGYFPHRYSRKTGFRNPSVYCGDLVCEQVACSTVGAEVSLGRINYTIFFKADVGQMVALSSAAAI